MNIQILFKQIISKYKEYHLIKVKGPQLFYYIDKHHDDLIRYTKKLIVEDIGPMTVFEVYGLYNGMIDFTAYLPQHRKDESVYYNRQKKDLSDQELAKWRREMNL